MRMKLLNLILSVLLVIIFSETTAFAFGLRCWTAKERYHYDITKAAIGAFNEDAMKEGRVGFQPNAANVIAYENDVLDVYGNHPLIPLYDFMEEEMDRLHFDNLVNAQEILNQWDRYMYGAFYGILWAKQNNDPLAALNILAVTLHAVQDFYSHSTWVNDPQRRCSSVFHFTRKEIKKLGESLWTGRYSDTDTVRSDYPAYIKNHGGEGFWSKIEKFAETCAHSGDYGIALDRPGSAKSSVYQEQRITPDKASGDTLFDAGVLLATKNSSEFLKKLEEWLKMADASGLPIAMGVSGFWERLKYYNEKDAPILTKDTGVSTIPREDKEYWKFSAFDISAADQIAPGNRRAFYAIAYPMVGSGTYPYNPDEGDWYFRVQIETANYGWQGTDNPVYFHLILGAYDKEILLDKYANLGDFEEGKSDAYFLGPFNFFPSQIKLTLDSIDGLQIKNLKVWAYKVGGEAAYDLIAKDEVVQIGNEYGQTNKSWAASVSEPDSPCKGGDWKFKVRIKTGTDKDGKWGGTWGDVYFRLFKDGEPIGGKKLDNSGIDFEQGDDDTYAIGPYKFPSKVMLELDNEDGLQIENMNVHALCGGQSYLLAPAQNVQTKNIQIGNELVITNNKHWEQAVTEPKSFGFVVSPFLKETIPCTALFQGELEKSPATSVYIENLPSPLKAVYIYNEQSWPNSMLLGVEYDKEIENLPKPAYAGAYTSYNKINEKGKTIEEVTSFVPSPICIRGCTGISRVAMKRVCKPKMNIKQAYNIKSIVLRDGTKKVIETKNTSEDIVTTNYINVILYVPTQVPSVTYTVPYTKTWSCE